MCKRPSTGVSFCQRATPIYGLTVPGTNGIIDDMITCWKCKRRSHRYQFFQKADDKGFQGIQSMFNQGIHPPFEGQFTHPSWLLIDTGSTFNSIYNHQFLKERDILFNNSVAVKWGNIVIHPFRVVISSSRP